ncbi:putative vacuolar membrane protein [Clavispora lusitaniae]|uniref:Vacuolar membrane protein n=3 Tax=Clavispora lusitaniae TaxID=36911 RepID=C4Y8J1_CLAL4|nr:uncharacterized protein CLUG_04519 [Clavispora lusitaniae ATCC 42720]KAF7581670.1 hypothetical protein FOB63_003293 [Clavispora lusitaniae]EEQ40391.1 hypothetical protein CLUG_04519 [Clavispora lusitaniae ATCC 42720]OVF04876.1 putative chitin synthase 3 complex protein [Clavispora lusitaniae]QFZ29083.1 putative vacuolar membrane protein [Clavispora lusitaniae]QFZ34746.1 putative vacuolar membrane protein [Clavispora lusitaniae]
MSLGEVASSTLQATVTMVLNNRDDMPSATTKAKGMPSLDTSTTQDFTTPSVTVPPNHNNPYIHRTNHPSGTVFIAVGSIVGFILLAFLAFYVVKSILASRLAKKSLRNEKSMYERFSKNNSTAYGGLSPSHSNFVGTEYQGSVAKLPLLNGGGQRSIFGGSQADTSTIYNGEVAATSNHDFTQMFVSPTRQVMKTSKQKSPNWNGSAANVSLYGKSATTMANPSPATNRHSQVVPQLYLNDRLNNSEVFSSTSTNQKAEDATGSPRSKRKTVPSMYLDDLIDG